MATKTTSYAALGLLAIPIVLPVLLISVLISVLSGSSASPAAAACGPTPNVGSPRPGTTADVGLDAAQMSVARQVVTAVRAFAPTAARPRAAVIALAVARQESGLRNVDYGDRDSLGVFQQRPSQGWGTPDQVRNIAHATTTFLQHLILVPGWEARRVTDVAADVQQPADEYRGLYQQWVPLTTRLTNDLWPDAGVVDTVPAGCTRTATSDPGQADSTTTIRAQSWVNAHVPYSQSRYFTNQYGTYRQDCSGYVSMAWGLSNSLTTYSLPSVAHPISKDQLRAGDIMLRAGHTLLFDSWVNTEHTAYWAYEEQHPGTVAVHHVVPYPYWPGQGTFSPYRKNAT